MKYKVAICDDDAAQREYLAEIVETWAGKNHCLAEVRQYPEAQSFLFEYGEKKDFDILLLDVEMPGMSGTALAKEVRRDNRAVQIIFVTGFYEYFSEGFDISALHYLIKPVGPEKLFPVLDRAADNLCSHQRAVLVVTPEAEVKIPLTNTAGGRKKRDFKTTRGSGHGLGLSRVDAIVKKYGGYVTRASEDEAFSTEILLPQE